VGGGGGVWQKDRNPAAQGHQEMRLACEGVLVTSHLSSALTCVRAPSPQHLVCAAVFWRALWSFLGMQHTDLLVVVACSSVMHDRPRFSVYCQSWITDPHARSHTDLTQLQGFKIRIVPFWILSTGLGISLSWYFVVITLLASLPADMLVRILWVFLFA
jgi:hypothetical protein